MQVPKIAWLKRTLQCSAPGRYERMAHFMDLGDWLAWRATAGGALHCSAGGSESVSISISAP